MEIHKQATLILELNRGRSREGGRYLKCLKSFIWIDGNGAKTKSVWSVCLGRHGVCACTRAHLKWLLII